MAYVYILKCSDDTLYTGIAKDLDKRIDTHRKGKGAKYTKCRLPVELMYSEEAEDWKSAMAREREIKKLSRSRKIKLIETTEKEIKSDKIQENQI